MSKLKMRWYRYWVEAYPYPDWFHVTGVLEKHKPPVPGMSLDYKDPQGSRVTRVEEVDLRPMVEPPCEWELNPCFADSAEVISGGSILTHLDWLRAQGHIFCPQCGRRLKHD